MTELALFTDLPVQLPPDAISSDAHVLHHCRRCDGTGRERCPYPRHYHVAQEWDPTCRGCGGGGWVLTARLGRWWRG